MNTLLTVLFEVLEWFKASLMSVAVLVIATGVITISTSELYSTGFTTSDTLAAVGMMTISRFIIYMTTPPKD